MSRIIQIMVLTLFSVGMLSAQNVSNNISKGNRYFYRKKYTDSEIEYRKALLRNPKSFEANYDLGNSLFRQKKYSEAVEKYNNAISLQHADKQKVAHALFNAGNALLADKKIDESIKAYKASLKKFPDDNEVRYNLAYAMKLKKEQDKQNKNKQKNNQNQNKNKDKQNQNKQNQDKQNQNQNQNQGQQPQPSKGQMSKENAQRILDALSQDEKNTQDKAKKAQSKTTSKAEKDW